jgi:hypothetical protein
VILSENFASTGNGTSRATSTNAASGESKAATLEATKSQAGASVIDLGSYGKLIAPVQVEGKWYYHWDLSGDGTSVDNRGSLNGGSDRVTMDWLEQTFFGSSTGAVINESNRTFSINGVNVALPTDGNISSSSHFQTSSNGGTYDPASPGTSASGNTPGSGYYLAKATSGTAGAGTTTNAGYDDMLAIWDATNATKNDSLSQGGFVSGYDGAPAGWQADHYWSATPSALGHALVGLQWGRVYDTPDGDGNTLYVALQVL